MTHWLSHCIRTADGRYFNGDVGNDAFSTDKEDAFLITPRVAQEYVDKRRHFPNFATATVEPFYEEP